MPSDTDSNIFLSSFTSHHTFFRHLRPQCRRRIFAYMIYKLLDHSVPLSLVILSSIFAISNKFNIVNETQDVWQFLQQIQAISFKSVISIQGLIRFPVHHIGFFLYETNNTWNPAIMKGRIYLHELQQQPEDIKYLKTVFKIWEY